ncbi:MAG: hypothetical protein AAGD13_20225 [Pseudomonadota bacterium]
MLSVDRIDLSATRLAFGDLTIQDAGANATIAYGTDQITVLGTNTVQLTQDQFEFGPKEGQWLVAL